MRRRHGEDSGDERWNKCLRILRCLCVRILKQPCSSSSFADIYVAWDKSARRKVVLSRFNRLHTSAEIRTRKMRILTVSFSSMIRAYIRDDHQNCTSDVVLRWLISTWLFLYNLMMSFSHHHVTKKQIAKNLKKKILVQWEKISENSIYSPSCGK